MMKALNRERTVDIGRTKESLLGTRNENLENKKMHSIFFRSAELSDDKTWSWFKKRELKKTAEDIIMAAQEQAIRTRSIIKHHINKENISPLCRPSGERDETADSCPSYV